MNFGIDMGHTLKGANYGAVGIIKESEATRIIGNKVIKGLTKLGHKVFNCTVDYAKSNNESLIKRSMRANSLPIDLFVSLHFNAGGGTGSEIFTYDAIKYSECVKILDNLKEVGFPYRGIKDGSHLSVIRNTKAKAMLVEVCFVDNKEDVKLFNSKTDDIADAIIYGLLNMSVPKKESDFFMDNTVKTHASALEPLAENYKEEIKILQKTVGLPQDGVGTVQLCKLLPTLKGNEQRGVVTVMQRLLILKGMLSKGSATGIIGEANLNALRRFKGSVGLPQGQDLVDASTWFKLIEY